MKYNERERERDRIRKRERKKREMRENRRTKSRSAQKEGMKLKEHTEGFSPITDPRMIPIPSPLLRTIVRHGTAGKQQQPVTKQQSHDF